MLCRDDPPTSFPLALSVCVDANVIVHGTPPQLLSLIPPVTVIVPEPEKLTTLRKLPLPLPGVNIISAYADPIRVNIAKVANNILVLIPALLVF